VYRDFFGLRDHPFSLNPDPRCLFLTPQTRNALDTLFYGIETRKGLILLTGEIGTGKTTLINRLQDHLRQQRTPVAFLCNPRLEPHHLFDLVLADLGVPSTSRPGADPRIGLSEHLLKCYRAGKRPALIVDEAQGLSVDVLEEIRLLLNLETPSEKLLQVVLVGQPEIEERLTRHELRQLRQRIALRCKTAPFSFEETRAYMQARLRIAGASAKPLFEPEAVDALHFYSRGIPRIINVLSEHSLISAYVRNLRPVPAGIVDEAAREFQLEHAKRPARPVDLGDAPSAQPAPITSTFASGPFVVARPAPFAKGELDRPSLAEGGTAVQEAWSQAMQRESARLADSTEFTSEDAFQLLCELALKSQTILSGPTLHPAESTRDVPATSAAERAFKHPDVQAFHPAAEARKLRSWQLRRRTWWPAHWLPMASSGRLTGLVMNWLESLRPIIRGAPWIHERWLSWRRYCYPIAFRERTVLLIRWLQEPWGQQMAACLPARGIPSRGRPIP